MQATTSTEGASPEREEQQQQVNAGFQGDQTQKVTTQRLSENLHQVAELYESVTASCLQNFALLETHVSTLRTTSSEHETMSELCLHNLDEISKQMKELSKNLSNVSALRKRVQLLHQLLHRFEDHCCKQGLMQM